MFRAACRVTWRGHKNGARGSLTLKKLTLIYRTPSPSSHFSLLHLELVSTYSTIYIFSWHLPRPTFCSFSRKSLSFLREVHHSDFCFFTSIFFIQCVFPSSRIYLTYFLAILFLSMPLSVYSYLRRPFSSHELPLKDWPQRKRLQLSLSGTLSQNIPSIYWRSAMKILFFNLFHQFPTLFQASSSVNISSHFTYTLIYEVSTFI